MLYQAALRRVTSSRHGARLLAGSSGGMQQHASPRPSDGRPPLTRQASSQSVRSVHSTHSGAPGSARGGAGGAGSQSRRHRRHHAAQPRATLSGPAGMLQLRPGLAVEAAAGAARGSSSVSGRHHAHCLTRRHRRNGSRGSLASLILSRSSSVRGLNKGAARCPVCGQGQGRVGGHRGGPGGA